MNQPLSPSRSNPNWPPPASPASIRSSNITRASASGIIPPPNIRSNTLPVLTGARNSEDLLRVGRYQNYNNSRENPVTPVMNQSSGFNYNTNRSGFNTPEENKKNSPSPSKHSGHKHSPSMPTELSSLRNQSSPGISTRPSQVNAGDIPRQLDFGNSLGGIDLAPSTTNSSSSNLDLNSSFDSRVAGLGFKDFSSTSNKDFYNIPPEKEKVSLDLSSNQTPNPKSKRNLVRNFWSGIKGEKRDENK